MKYSMTAAVLALSMLLAGCGGDSYESLADDTVDVLKDMTDILASIDSKDAAEKAASKLESLAWKMQEISKRAEALGEPSEKQKTDMDEMMSKKMEGVMGRYMQEMMRVAQIPDAMQYLEKAMEKTNPGR